MHIETGETVTIPKAEYDTLLRESRELQALAYAGVDNWQGREYINWEYVETGKGNPNRD